jgi:hypothetical protein
MLLNMVSIPSTAQLSNHDQDPTKALLMWHKKHYPRLHDLLDILDLEPWGAPDAPPTQVEQNLATTLEELKIMPQIADNTQKKYHSLQDQNACMFGCYSCGMLCILPSVSGLGVAIPPLVLWVFPTDAIFSSLMFSEEEMEEWNELSDFKQCV